MIENLAAAPPLQFWVFACGSATASAYLGFLAFRALRWRRKVQDMPTSRTRSAPQGYIELQGQAKMMDGPPIAAPMSGRPCVWWQLVVEEVTDGSWRSVSRECSDGLFLIEDDTGQCIVDPDGATVTPAHRRVSRGGSRRAAPMRSAGSRYRYTETFIECGDELYVVGWHRTLSSVAQWNPDDELLLKLREWKRDQSDLLRRFDANSDGRIDQEEWDQAKREARREVLAEHREASVLPGVNVISAPDDKRPFLIAAHHGDLVAVALRRSTIGHAIGAVLLAVFSALLFQARFANFF